MDDWIFFQSIISYKVSPSTGQVVVMKKFTSQTGVPKKKKPVMKKQKIIRQLTTQSSGDVFLT